MHRIVLLATLGLLLAPAFAAPPAAATSCYVDFDSPEGIVAGATCVVVSEACLFTGLIRPNWCPV